MDLGLKGKVALVAGGGRGIGRAVALGLAREGVDVAVLGRTRKDLDETAAQVRAVGVRSLALPADVRDRAGLDAAFSTLASTLGAPTLLVLGVAAVWEPRKLQFLEDAEAADLLDTDLGGAVALCHRALPGMVDARFGRVVALGSLAAQTGMPGGTLYAAAKAGLEGLVRGVALDYGRRGITANTVSIGFVETERLQARLAGDAAARERLERATARRTILEPREVADAVVFLCSDLASGITGAVLPVTAGAHLNNLW